jgi:hypothetical protein
MFLHFIEQLWRAPEFHQSVQSSMSNQIVCGTQRGDVYSFAIIVQEIFYRKGVFYLDDKDKLLTFGDENKDVAEIYVTDKGTSNKVTKIP